MNTKELEYKSRNFSSSMKLACHEYFQKDGNISIESLAHYWSVSVSGLKKALKKIGLNK